MPSNFLIVALAAILPVAQAHFTFMRLAHNGVWHDPLRYIRNRTAPFDEPHHPSGDTQPRLYTFPTYASDLPNSARCGRDNMAWAAQTEVLKVKAGDDIEMVVSNLDPYRWAPEPGKNCRDDLGFCGPPGIGASLMIHDGPVIVHLSKVPEEKDVHEYDGSGNWTKIYTMGLEVRKNDTDKPVYWLPVNRNSKSSPRVIAKLPKQTPAGQYLLRFSQLWPGFIYIVDGKTLGDYEAQLYSSCAQIEVESDNTGSLPEDSIKIPEDLCKKCPGMQISQEMYQDKVVDAGYVYPGGKLWDGEKLLVDAPPS